MADLQPAKSKPFVVRGQVSHSDGSPLAEGLVRANDWDLRSETPLGEAEVDKESRYEISYSADRGGATGEDHHDRDSMPKSNRIQMV
jgi:hypothetical protein